MEWVSVFTYLVALAVFTAAGAPIAAVLFRALPRTGAAFALPSALVPFAVVTFWLGQLTFGRHTLAVAVAVVLGGSLLAYRHGPAPEWRSVAGAYGVYAAGFVLMVAFRAADPAITPAGGERFLHFGLVNAIERANSLPPEDVWFAGRPLRYYYGTQLQVASLSMLTGTPLRYGFNLGIAAFYALLVVVAYGVGGTIVARRGRSYRLGGAFGVFFVALAGPTTTAVRLATPYVPDVVAGPLKAAAFGFVAQRFEGGDLAAAVAELSRPLDWSWWYTRYVVQGTIQEVPLYSFVKADLHGHTFANGYVLFAGALGLAYYATPAGQRRRRGAIVFGGFGALAGLFGFMNTWSLPTAAGVAVLAVAAADAHPATLLPERWERRLRLADGTGEGKSARLLREGWRLVLAGAAGIAVLAIGVVIASPFLVFGQVPTNDGIGLFPPRTSLDQFLVIYAGLLTLFALIVLVRGRRAVASVSTGRLASDGAVLIGVVLIADATIDAGVGLLLVALIVPAWVLVRTDRGDFTLVLLIAGAGLLLSLELVHARLPLIDNPRWNTSLKVAVQGWTLGAAGAGAASAVLLSRSLDRVVGSASGSRERAERESTAVGSMLGSLASVTGGSADEDAPGAGGPSTGDGDGRGGPIAVVAVVAAVVLASAVFTVMMVGAEVGAGMATGTYAATLDGHENARQAHASEYEALVWLKNRGGRPTIVEAPGDTYGWTSPAATFSGLPSVVGWDHEAEYRGPEAYQRRVDHVDAIYTGDWATAAGHLQRYDVTYVYVGPNERERYGDGLRSFDRPAFDVATSTLGATVYEANQSALDRSVVDRSASNEPVPNRPPAS